VPHARLLAFVALTVTALCAAPRLATQSAPRGLPTVTLTNGPAVVDEAVVVSALPRGLGGEHFQLREDDGTATPVQVTRDRNIVFLVRSLRPNEGRRYRLEPALASEPRGGVEARKELDRVDLRLDGHLVVTYNADRTELPRPGIDPVYRRGGYLHPIRTPLGRIVTDDYAPDHLHHHGIWMAWAGARFQGRRPDFWNMGQRTGTVEFESLLDVWSGPFAGGVRARHRYVDLSAPVPVVALTEVWEVTLAAVGRGKRAHRQFDLVSTQETARQDPLELTEYLYGPLGLRGHRSWVGPHGTQFLTSEGRSRVDGHGTRARWCAMSGLVAGRRVGVAIFDHPANVRHPQPMRLHPSEPFFSYAPAQAGPMIIEPGRPLISRYRVIAFDGAPDAAWLESLWQAYAHGPTAMVGY
jgi:hypothetical protein